MQTEFRQSGIFPRSGMNTPPVVLLDVILKISEMFKTSARGKREMFAFDQGTFNSKENIHDGVDFK